MFKSMMPLKNRCQNDAWVEVMIPLLEKSACMLFEAPRCCPLSSELLARVPLPVKTILKILCHVIDLVETCKFSQQLFSSCPSDACSVSTKSAAELYIFLCALFTETRAGGRRSYRASSQPRMLTFSLIQYVALILPVFATMKRISLQHHLPVL